MCAYGSHFHKYTEEHGELSARQAIKIPSPSIFVEVVMSLQLLLLHTAATNSGEVSHPISDGYTVLL